MSPRMCRDCAVQKRGEMACICPGWFEEVREFLSKSVCVRESRQGVILTKLPLLHLSLELTCVLLSLGSTFFVLRRKWAPNSH